MIVRTRGCAQSKKLHSRVGVRSVGSAVIARAQCLGQVGWSLDEWDDGIKASAQVPKAVALAAIA